MRVGRPPINGETKNIRLEIRMNEAENEALTRLSNRFKISKSEAIRIAIERMLESFER